MQRAPLPHDEPDRLAVLEALDVLDTEAETRFDRITALARDILRVPIALVSLVDRERQWFKSRQGLAAEETPRDVSFCGHAILRPEPLVVPDAHLDPRFADNPLVVGEPHVRFYAGCPLIVRGHAVGTLCVIDHEPRVLARSDLDVLITLAEIVSAELERGDGATTDPATGLLGRWGFMEHARQALHRAVVRGERVGLLRVDVSVDGAAVTETDLLGRLGAMLDEQHREASVIGRLHGGSFALCFVGDECAALEPVARWLERSLTTLSPSTSCHVGHTLCRPRSASQLALVHLLEAAEAALPWTEVATCHVQSCSPSRLAPAL